MAHISLEEEKRLTPLRNAWGRLKKDSKATPDDIHGAWDIVHQERLNREDATHFEIIDLLTRLDAQMTNNPSTTKKSINGGRQVEGELSFKVNGEKFIFFTRRQGSQTTQIAINILHVVRGDNNDYSIDRGDQFLLNSDGAFAHYFFGKLKGQRDISKKIIATNLDSFDIFLKENLSESIQRLTSEIMPCLTPIAPQSPQ